MSAYRRRSAGGGLGGGFQYHPPVPQPDSDEPQTLQEFARIDMGKLNDDLGVHRSNLESVLNEVIKLSGELAESGDNETTFGLAKEILGQMPDYDSIMHKLDRDKAAMVELQAMFLRGENPWELAEDLAEDYVNRAMGAKHVKTRPSAHWVNKCKEILYEATKDPEFAPQLGEDEDLVMTGQVETFQDPLTAAVIKNIIKSRICGHIFEYSTIREMIISEGGYCECPHTGCNQFVRIGDLVKDPGLERRHRRFLQQQMEIDEDEEYEEV